MLAKTLETLRQDVATLKRKLVPAGGDTSAGDGSCNPEREDDGAAAPSFSVSLPVCTFDEFDILEEELKAHRQKKKQLVSNCSFNVCDERPRFPVYSATLQCLLPLCIKYSPSQLQRV